MAVKLPSTGLATIDFPIMGIDATESTSQYFTTPAAASTGQILAAVNGAMFLNGVQVAVITSIDFTINGTMTTGDVVGSNVAPDIFPGSVDVTGTHVGLLRGRDVPVRVLQRRQKCRSWSR